MSANQENDFRCAARARRRHTLAPSLNRRLPLSPGHAIVSIKMGCRSRCHFPGRLGLCPVIDMRVTVRPPRWPVCGDESVPASGLERPDQKDLQPATVFKRHSQLLEADRQN